MDGPHHHTQQVHQLEENGVVRVQIPGIQHHGEEGDPLDHGGGTGEESQCRLKGKESDFESRGDPNALEDQNSDDTNDTGETARHRAEHQISHGLQAELRALRDKNMLFLFDESDQDHHGASHEGDQITEQKHKNTP